MLKFPFRDRRRLERRICSVGQLWAFQRSLLQRGNLSYSNVYYTLSCSFARVLPCSYWRGLEKECVPFRGPNSLLMLQETNPSLLLPTPPPPSISLENERGRPTGPLSGHFDRSIFLTIKATQVLCARPGIRLPHRVSKGNSGHHSTEMSGEIRVEGIEWLDIFDMRWDRRIGIVFFRNSYRFSFGEPSLIVLFYYLALIMAKQGTRWGEGLSKFFSRNNLTTF